MNAAPFKVFYTALNRLGFSLELRKLQGHDLFREAEKLKVSTFCQCFDRHT